MGLDIGDVLDRLAADGDFQVVAGQNLNHIGEVLEIAVRGREEERPSVEGMSDGSIIIAKQPFLSVLFAQFLGRSLLGNDSNDIGLARSAIELGQIHVLRAILLGPDYSAEALAALNSWGRPYILVLSVAAVEALGSHVQVTWVIDNILSSAIWAVALDPRSQRRLTVLAGDVVLETLGVVWRGCTG